MKESQEQKKDLKDRAFERLDVRMELAKLDAMIDELKVVFEQYFLGLTPYAPDKLHNQVKRQIRTLRRAPFKNSQMGYQLRTLEGRYNTLNTYWARVLREREAGTYHRDVFKANLRERLALESRDSAIS